VTAVTDDYFLEIEAHFAMRRGTPFILSAKDWVLMKKWRDDGIPLPVVIEAIDSVFEKNETSGRRKVISSLSYCRHAVKEIWNDRKDLGVGADGEAPEGSVRQILDRLAGALEGAGLPQPLGAEFSVRLRELSADQSIPRIEERLIEVERDLIEKILEDPSVAGEIRAEAARSLGEASKIDEKTRARTEEANIRRIVRERYGLPRLTLFR
jgi:hypothetical protein